MNEKLLKNINYYGVNHQQRKLQEEVFELQEAIIRKEYLPNEKDVDEELFCMNMEIEQAKEHIIEEIADVQVLLNQFKLYYEISDAEVKEVMIEKIDRQMERMEEKQ